ncbi:hypothetical protein J4216_04420 [Candidatus Woesearchaeota archaeon]|nr:hypothetical protein [Candidatus Woesearchaeota archaeon]
MEVKISFDTEKESVEDLKRLVSALQDLINKREGLTNQTQKPQPQVQPGTTHLTQNSQPQVAQKPAQTVGGGRVMDYRDMSDVISKIASGQKKLI